MRIILTGATAGFGQVAAQHMADAGAQLLIGARGAAGRTSGFAAEMLELDLASLASVRAFADAVLAGPSIKALVCNGGLQFGSLAQTAEGFERTFAVNHLSHYLLIRLLLPALAPGARVIMTGSGTHDPAEKSIVTPPRHAEADWLAFPDRDPNPEKSPRNAGFRAYSSSKLCNIMTARELAVRHPALSTMAFDPGYVPGTRLGRDNPAWIAWLAGKIIPLTMKRDRTSTVAASGCAHADLALSADHASERGTYWAMRGGRCIAMSPSALAQNAAACAKLWDDSARLVGL
jgi:NAD(P)-dependent dehydrogenase (short-subunit alcohol dehydrogenase family)